MLKLAGRARGHFVTLIEIRVHLISVKPVHISVKIVCVLFLHYNEHSHLNDMEIHGTERFIPKGFEPGT